MDMKKLVAMAVLVVVIVVAVVIVVKRTSNEAPPMTAEADKTLDMIDMKSLEVFSETPADWNGKYAADASGRHKNPKTGEYTDRGSDEVRVLRTAHSEARDSRRPVAAGAAGNAEGIRARGKQRRNV